MGFLIDGKPKKSIRYKLAAVYLPPLDVTARPAPEPGEYLMVAVGGAVVSSVSPSPESQAGISKPRQ